MDFFLQILGWALIVFVTLCLFAAVYSRLGGLFYDFNEWLDRRLKEEE